MLTQLLSTLLLLAAVLLSAAGIHWRRVGLPPALSELRTELSVSFYTWLSVWESEVQAPFEVGFRELAVEIEDCLDRLASWATRLPQPRLATVPVAIESTPPTPTAYAPFEVKICINSRSARPPKTLFAPAGTSHRWEPGKPTFDEWRLRTWADTLHAASVELIRDKKEAAVTGVEVLYGRLTEVSNPGFLPVGAR